MLFLIIVFDFNQKGIDKWEVVAMVSEIDHVRIGKRIHSVRKECLLAQDVLASQCGCTKNHLSAVEIGKCKPSLELVIKIASILDSSVDFFIMNSPHVNTRIRSPRSWSHAPAGNFP